MRKAIDEVRQAALDFDEALGKRNLMGKRTRPQDFASAFQSFRAALKNNSAVLYSRFAPMSKTRSKWAPGYVVVRALHPDKAALEHLDRDEPVIVSAKGLMKQRLFAGLAPPRIVIREVSKMFRPPV